MVRITLSLSLIHSLSLTHSLQVVVVVIWMVWWTGLAVCVNLCRECVCMCLTFSCLLPFYESKLHPSDVRILFYCSFFFSSSLFIFYYRCCYCRIKSIRFNVLFIFISITLFLSFLSFQICSLNCAIYFIVDIHVAKKRDGVIVYWYSTLHLRVEVISLLNIIIWL